LAGNTAGGILVRDTATFYALWWAAQNGEVWREGDIVYFRNKWFTLVVPVNHINLLGAEIISSDMLEAEYGYLDVSGRVVADIGAYLGETAIYFAKRGAKLVHAYEPVFHRFIAKNLEVNGLTNVVVHPYGLWTEADKFRVALAGVGTGLMPGDVEIEVRPMADAITEVVKLDCEGCEWALIVLPCDIIRRAEEYAIEIHGAAVPIIRKMEK
jgi:FkbM family methyltransferase